MEVKLELFYRKLLDSLCGISISIFFNGIIYFYALLCFGANPHVVPTNSFSRSQLAKATLTTRKAYVVGV